MEFRLSSPCRGSNTFDAIPLKDVMLTRESMEQILRNAGLEVKLASDVLVLGKKGGVEVGIYRRGKLIIKNVKGRQAAEKIASQIFSRI